jgi:hypothetical protein
MYLGTLAGGLECFPLAYEAYPSQTHSRVNVDGIRSLNGFGRVVAPLAQSVLYLRYTSREAVPKDISGRTRYL